MFDKLSFLTLTPHNKKCHHGFPDRVGVGVRVGEVDTSPHFANIVI